MAAHPPPVPPEQRSDKGPPATEAEPIHEPTGKPPDPKTGRTGAIKQNTTNQGYQQDR